VRLYLKARDAIQTKNEAEKQAVIKELGVWEMHMGYLNRRLKDELNHPHTVPQKWYLHRKITELGIFYKHAEEIAAMLGMHRTTTHKPL